MHVDVPITRATRQPEREQFLCTKLQELTKLHIEKCPPYARLLQLFYGQRSLFTSLSAIPYLPVSLFKTQKLLSIPESEVFKVIRSSGTTGTNPSQVFVDAATAKRQSQALVQTITELLGPKRLPMLIVDHAHVITERRSLNARGAAIMGMLSFGRDVCYALNEDMSVNHASLQAWLTRNKNQATLLFGLTFVIWAHFLSQLQVGELELAKSLLIHTGGWKKMEELSIDNAAFKQVLREKTAIKHCYNFYGMAEQVGCVFVECEQGYLHCPPFAEVIIRHPRSWQESVPGHVGVIQSLSILPTSYPGHSLLTEDLGILHGIDDCPCGHRGKYFSVLGRVPHVEMRGCSDTMVGQHV